LLALHLPRQLFLVAKPRTMDAAAEVGEWKTLIPAYLLKEDGEMVTQLTLEECKTLVPMAAALRCLANVEAGSDEVEKSAESAEAQTLLQLCVEGEVVPELQTEQLSEADGALAIPLTAEDCRAFLRMLANRPGGDLPTKPECSDAQVPALSNAATEEAETFPVWLHVYDLTDGFHLPILNSALRAAGAGLFHAGVEVHGNEFSFGMTRHCGTGIYVCEPKSNTGHSYRESILLGYTSTSRKELRKLTKEMKKEWMGPSYRLISKNCIHFSSAFSQRLGVAEVPRWVFGMATLAKELVDGIASSSEALTRAVSFTDCNGRQVLDEKSTVLVL